MFWEEGNQPPLFGEDEMTSTIEKEAITQALELIDRTLGTMHTRELVSTSEMSDVLLDMRSVLALIRRDEHDDSAGATSSSGMPVAITN